MNEKGVVENVIFLKNIQKIEIIEIGELGVFNKSFEICFGEEDKQFKTTNKINGNMITISENNSCFDITMISEQGNKLLEYLDIFFIKILKLKISDKYFQVFVPMGDKVYCLKKCVVKSWYKEYDSYIYYGFTIYSSDFEISKGE